MARVIQGVGGALLTPGSLAIIEATFRQEDRGRAIGAWSALTGIAGAVGPLVGGYLIDAVSWRAIFLINLPLGAFVVWASRRHVPETRDPTITGALDLRGSALRHARPRRHHLRSDPGARRRHRLAHRPCRARGRGSARWSPSRARSARVPQPMLPLSIFSSRQFTSANLVTFVVYAALGAVFFLLVVFLQVALGYTAIEAGAASLPGDRAHAAALPPRRRARAADRPADSADRRARCVVAVGMFLMSEIDVGDTYVEAILPGVVVFGLGLSLVVAPVTITVLAAADPRQAGVASGVNNAVARTAGLLAVAVAAADRRAERRRLPGPERDRRRLHDRDAGRRRAGRGRRRARPRHDPRRRPRAGEGAGSARVPGGDRPGARAPLRRGRHAPRYCTSRAGASPHSCSSR